MLSGDMQASRIRVMVVDDSAIIRGLLTRALESDPEIRVVASVGNGSMALAALDRTAVDVVILDLEMPVMDGLTALPKLMAARPGLPVIVASTLSQVNADVSVRALAAGAADCIAKPSSGRGLGAAEDFNRQLIDKVKVLGGKTRPAPLRAQLRPGEPIRLRAEPIAVPQVLAIGSSTGGPQALLAILSEVARPAGLPILVVQHMPATFTVILAEHLAQASGVPAAEGRDGEPLAAGRIYVAPGGRHMMVGRADRTRVIRLSRAAPENFCRPSVNPLLRSVAGVYGRHALAVILTGMGQDGLDGAEAIVAAGGAVLAQDQATSAVWGMPGAVAAAGLCSAVLPLPEIAPYIRKLVLRSAA